MSITRSVSGSITTSFDAATVAIQQSAKAITAVASSVDMFEAFIREAKVDQQDRHKIHRSIYRTQLIEDAAQDELVRREKLELFLAKNTNRVQLFNEIHDRLENLFTETQP